MRFLRGLSPIFHTRQNSIFYFSPVQKLSERLSTLTKSSLPEKDKRKWKSVLIKEFMSSEESESDDESSPLVKRTIPWRSSKVSNFFTELDKHSDSYKSTQSRRQTRARALSDVASARPLPAGKFPDWALSVDK